MPISLGKSGKVLKLSYGLNPVLQGIRSLPKVRQEFIQSNLNDLVTRIASITPHHVRLVVDAHGRSTGEIRAAYDVGQRHFAVRAWANIEDKAVHLPDDIKWHVLGPWKMNQAKWLRKDSPGLWAVESVDTWPKAQALQRSLQRSFQRAARLAPWEPMSGPLPRIHVFIQVNLGEENVHIGAKPWNVRELAENIVKCPHLNLVGLMSDRNVPSHLSYTEGKRRDLEMLVALRRDVVRAIPQLIGNGIMGLSMPWRNIKDDIEWALKEMRVSEVRVGKEIFGVKEKKVVKPWDADEREWEAEEVADEGDEEGEEEG